ncbi:hypothetical protein IP84_08530 [beta proteobacterium AAP99]|nr:hypothetical protein IP84_08530 [beta proteobacterium AAP99]
MRRTFSTGLVAAALLALAGCATPSPAVQPAPALPDRWNATSSALVAGNPAAHGASRTALQDWWAQFDDPALLRLQAAAQESNGSVVQAAARIEQARAGLRSAGAANVPQLNGSGAASRGLQSGAPQISNSASIGLDALWEIDLFGAGRANRSAALAQLESSQAAWHDARVSLAAEVAQTYVNLRACEQTARVLQQDVRSQQTSAGLTERKVQAGLEAPANGALVRASAADSALRLAAQQAQCEVLIKSLVALTALPEAQVRSVLAARTATLPTPRAFAVDALPAQWLTQRPDLRAIERDAAAALRDVDAAQAQRWPRLSLVGSVSRLRVESGSATALSTPWSIGPSLSLPIFDAGRRSAAVDAARARYAEARSRYEQRARDAVREVEEALVRMDAAQRREADALTAAQGFATFLDAQRKRTDAGAGSLLDLEEARRTALNAQSSLISVQAERVSAWISLYRAVGGGWSMEMPALPASKTAAPAVASTSAR